MRYIFGNKIILISALIYVVAGIFLCGLCYIVNSNSVFNHNIQIWNTACQYIDFFLPLFSPIAFVVALFYRKKDRFLEYLYVRTDKKRYLIKYFSTAMLATILLTALMYYVALVFSVVVLKSTPAPGNDYFNMNFFGKYQADVPLVFGLFWCVWKGFIAGIFTVGGCLLALYIENIFIAVIAPFIYVMVENLITGLLGIPRFSLFTSLDFNRLDPTSMHLYDFVIGVIIYVLIFSIIILVAKRREKYVHLTH